MQHITFGIVYQLAEELNHISDMKEEDVRDIWIQPYENFDITSLQYNYNIPLYQKMIFRFRQCEQSPFRFCSQLDPNNQFRMLSYYKIYDDNKQLINFCSWLKNGIGIHDLYELDGALNKIDDINQSELYQLWKINEIKFFFGINYNKQLSLINKYNKECIDAYLSLD